MNKKIAGRGGRPATGTVEWKHGRWWARITLADKTRPLVALDPAIPHDDEPRARACAADVSRAARGMGGVSALVRETIAEYSTRWLAYRRACGLTSVDDDKGRLTKWVLPILGPLDVRRITRDPLEALVADLDERVRRGELAWKTAMHAWSLVTTLFDDASACKRKELRVRADNPAKGVRGPDIGSRKAKVYLYPAEFAKLMACDDVPLGWRRTFAVATYLYLRAGEANALTWDEVDLEHGIVHVHRSANRRTGAVTSTKSDAARKVPIDPALMPLLRAMHAEAGGTDDKPAAGRVLGTKTTDKKLSRQLRRCLGLAGVTRVELFDDDEAARSTRKAITFHDLRATGITWAAVRGDDPVKIMHRAGHCSLSTTQLYIREAENFTDGFGVPFPSIPPAVVGLAPAPLAPLAVCTAPPPVEDALNAEVAPTITAAASEVSSPGFGFVTPKARRRPVSQASMWRRRESNESGARRETTRVARPWSVSPDETLSS